MEAISFRTPLPGRTKSGISRLAAKAASIARVAARPDCSGGGEGEWEAWESMGMKVLKLHCEIAPASAGLQCSEGLVTTAHRALHACLSARRACRRKSRIRAATANRPHALRQDQLVGLRLSSALVQCISAFSRARAAQVCSLCQCSFGLARAQ